MREGADDAVLAIGFGPPEGGGEGPMIMRSWARAMKTGDWDKAWSLFEEAIAACDDAHGEKKEEDSGESPFASKGKGEDDEGDLEF